MVQPETLTRWHRAGFRSFWWWKSRRCQYEFQESTPLGELMHNCLATAFAHTKLLLLCPLRADWCYRQSMIRYPTRYRSNPSSAEAYDHRDLGATNKPRRSTDGRKRMCSLGTSTSEPSLFEPTFSWMKLPKSPITAGPEWLGRRNYKSMPANGLCLE